MRYTKMHFHHTPGNEHEHPHCHEHVEGSARTNDRTVQLLEYLCHHNEEHAKELAGYKEGVENLEAQSLLEESVTLLKQSNAKLADAIDALKGSD